MNYSYLVQQRRQLIAFTRLLSSYGCAGDGDAMCDACGPCEARLWLEAHDLAVQQKARALNDREREVLREFSHDDNDWLRPMDLGGHDGSDHSAVLMRLVQKGYVEMKPAGGHCRMSWRYRKVPVEPPTPRSDPRD